MTYRLKMFCAAYAKTLDYDQSIIDAGIPKKPAVSLLDDPEVSVEIARQLAERAARLTIDGDMIVIELKNTAKEAREKGDFKAAIEAYKIMAEMVGAKTKNEVGRPAGRMMDRQPVKQNGSMSFGGSREEPDVSIVEGIAQFDA